MELLYRLLSDGIDGYCAEPIVEPKSVHICVVFPGALFLFGVGEIAVIEKAIPGWCGLALLRRRLGVETTGDRCLEELALLSGLSIILVSEGSEADDFSPQPGTLNIGEYEPGTIALAAMGTGLCT